jgi:hypothetical protein
MVRTSLQRPLPIRQIRPLPQLGGAHLRYLPIGPGQVSTSVERIVAAGPEALGGLTVSRLSGGYSDPRVADSVC